METEKMFEKALSELDRLLNAGSTLGKPVEMGNHIIIPVASMGFGFGAGFGGDSAKNMGGTGAGGGLSAVAVVIIDKTAHGDAAVKIMPLRKPGPVSEAITAIGEELLPKVVEIVKTKEKAAEKPVVKKEEPKK